MSKKGKEARREAMRRRLEAGSKSGNSGGKSFFKDGLGDISFWRPEQKGTHEIDIIDYIAGSQDRLAKAGDPTYSADFLVHFGVGPGEETFLCLAENFGEPCPICEHRKQLKTDGADDDVWKALFPKRRNLYNVVVYDSTAEEEKGVQVWHVSYHYMEKYLAALAKTPSRRRSKDGFDSFIDFSEQDEGKSISFTIEPPKSKDDFAKYIGHRFIDRDYKIDQEIQDSAHTLDELLYKPTYDEIYKAYWNVDLTDEEETTVEEEEVDEVVEETPVEEEVVERKSTGRRKPVKRQPPEKAKDDNPCPNGHVFGEDCSEKDECEDCPIETYNACLELFESK